MLNAKSDSAKSFTGRAWRPAALARAEAIVSGVKGFARSFAWNAARPVYSRFSRNSPALFWPRLSFEFERRQTPYEFRGRINDSARNAAFPTADYIAVPVRHVSREEQSSSNRLAIDHVRPASIHPRKPWTTPGSEAPLQQVGNETTFPQTERTFTNVLLTRPMLRLPLDTTSAIPRREVPGGFPSSDIRVLWLAEPTSPAPKPPPSQLHSSSVDSKATESFQQPVPGFTTTRDTQPAIQALIETTTQPINIADLQVKLAPAKSHFTESEVNSVRHEDNETSHPFAAVRPAPTQQVDINQLADKVYQTLMRRQQIERERRGLY